MRPAQSPHGRCPLVLRLLHDLRFGRSLHAGQREPAEHAGSRQHPNRLQLPVHRCVRDHLGPLGLGHRRRALPCEIQGHVHGARDGE